MDTALALMDAREPVYPLDIVQGMRDQRACMVQNVVSNVEPLKAAIDIVIVISTNFSESIPLCMRMHMRSLC